MPGFEWLGKEEREAVLDVMDRGVLFRYEFKDQRQDAWRVKEFEEAFARYTGAGFACAVSSGTAAVKVGLAALGVGGGDEVITQGFTFVATWEAIFDCGATPVFCEIDETMGMDPADLEAKITERTKAIVPVHMMGAPARIKEIKAIADKHGIPVMEDTAQSAGCTLDGRHVGTFGAMGSFSFDAVKTLTTGEGGMVITNDEALYQNASEYQDHGHDHAPVGRGNESRRFIGFNFRMMELQGALGLAQLGKLDDMVAAYRSAKASLKEALARIPGLTFREILDPAGDSATFVTWLMPDEDQAKRLAGMLGEQGFGPVHWGVNTWHAHPHWEHLHEAKTVTNGGWPFTRAEGDVSYAATDLPQTAALLNRTLSWQIMLGWDEDHLKKMTEAINRVVTEW